MYNNNSGNWRFDEVNVLGTAGNTNPITSDPIVNTTGLVNPDGLLAVVPNTYPIEVLYISKTLNSDYVPPTSYPACPASIPNGNFNNDVEVVRMATTTNFIKLHGYHATQYASLFEWRSGTAADPDGGQQGPQRSVDDIVFRNPLGLRQWNPHQAKQWQLGTILRWRELPG